MGFDKVKRTRVPRNARAQKKKIQEEEDEQTFREGKRDGTTPVTIERAYPGAAQNSVSGTPMEAGRHLAMAGRPGLVPAGIKRPPHPRQGHPSGSWLPAPKKLWGGVGKVLK